MMYLGLPTRIDLDFGSRRHHRSYNLVVVREHYFWNCRSTHRRIDRSKRRKMTYLDRLTRIDLGFGRSRHCLRRSHNFVVAVGLQNCRNYRHNCLSRPHSILNISSSKSPYKWEHTLIHHSADFLLNFIHSVQSRYSIESFSQSFDLEIHFRSANCAIFIYFTRPAINLLYSELVLSVVIDPYTRAMSFA